MKYTYTVICTTKQNDLLSADARTLSVGNKLIITSIPKYPTKKLNQAIEKLSSDRIFIISPFAERLPDNILTEFDNIDSKLIGYNQAGGCKEIKDKVTDNTTSIVIDRELFEPVNDMSGQGDYLFYINQLILKNIDEYVIVHKRKAGRLIDIRVKVDKEKVKKEAAKSVKPVKPIEYVYKRKAGKLIKMERDEHDVLVVARKTATKSKPNVPVSASTNQKRISGKLITSNTPTFKPRYVQPVTVFFILGTDDSHTDYMANPLLDTIKASYTKTVLVSDDTEFESKFDERIPYPPSIGKSKHLTTKDKKQIEAYCNNIYTINDTLFVYPDTSWLDILPKKKIVCIIPIHDRESITIETVKMLKRQSYPFYSIILVGDTALEEKIAEETGSHFVKFANRPLSRKIQAGIDEARKFNPDAIMIVGSDDWLTYKYNETYIKYIDDYDVIGNKEWLVLQVLNNENIELIRGSYNNNREDPVGAGRTITRGLLDRMDWQIYDFNKERSLDSFSFKRMKAQDATVKLLKDPDAVLCSIKSTWSCISPFNKNTNKINYIRHYQGEFNKIFPGADESLDKLAKNYTWT